MFHFFYKKSFYKFACLAVVAFCQNSQLLGDIVKNHNLKLSVAPYNHISVTGFPHLFVESAAGSVANDNSSLFSISTNISKQTITASYKPDQLLPKGLILSVSMINSTLVDNISNGKVVLFISDSPTLNISPTVMTFSSSKATLGLTGTLQYSLENTGKALATSLNGISGVVTYTYTIIP